LWAEADRQLTEQTRPIASPHVAGAPKRVAPPSTDLLGLAIFEDNPYAIPVGGGAPEWGRFKELAKIPTTADAAKWWFERRTTYPLLYREAVRSMVTQATSISSERSFSAMGRVITEKRTRLTGTRAEQLNFLHANADLLAARSISELML